MSIYIILMSFYRSEPWT